MNNVNSGISGNILTRAVKLLLYSPDMHRNGGVVGGGVKDKQLKESCVSYIALVSQCNPLTPNDL
jgi:hypothetical protein